MWKKYMPFNIVVINFQFKFEIELLTKFDSKLTFEKHN